MKTFTNLYTVIRYAHAHDPVVLGIFKTYEAADDYKGSKEQEMIDRYGQGDGWIFEIQLATYYND